MASLTALTTTRVTAQLPATWAHLDAPAHAPHPDPNFSQGHLSRSTGWGLPTLLPTRCSGQSARVPCRRPGSHPFPVPGWEKVKPHGGQQTCSHPITGVGEGVGWPAGLGSWRGGRSCRFQTSLRPRLPLWKGQDRVLSHPSPAPHASAPSPSVPRHTAPRWPIHSLCPAQWEGLRAGAGMAVAMAADGKGVTTQLAEGEVAGGSDVPRCQDEC